MFCGNCGSKVSDKASFCPVCGKKIERFENRRFSNTEGNEKNRNRIIGIAVVLLVLLLALKIFTGGQGEKAVVRKLMEAAFDMKVENYLDIYPEAVLEVAMEQDGISSEELIRELGSALSEIHEKIDDLMEGGWSYSWKITDKEKLDRAELKELKDEYQDLGIYNMGIKEGKTLSVTVTIKEKGGMKKTESASLDMTVIRIRNSWYLDIFSVIDLASMGMMFY